MERERLTRSQDSVERVGLARSQKSVERNKGVKRRKSELYSANPPTPLVLPRAGRAREGVSQVDNEHIIIIIIIIIIHTINHTIKQHQARHLQGDNNHPCCGKCPRSLSDDPPLGTLQTVVACLRTGPSRTDSQQHQASGRLGPPSDDGDLPGA